MSGIDTYRHTRLSRPIHDTGVSVGVASPEDLSGQLDRLLTVHTRVGRLYPHLAGWRGHTALGSVQLRVLKGCGRVVIGLDVSPSCFMRRSMCTPPTRAGGGAWFAFDGGG